MAITLGVMTGLDQQIDDLAAQMRDCVLDWQAGRLAHVRQKMIDLKRSLHPQRHQEEAAVAIRTLYDLIGQANQQLNTLNARQAERAIETAERHLQAALDLVECPLSSGSPAHQLLCVVISLARGAATLLENCESRPYLFRHLDRISNRVEAVRQVSVALRDQDWVQQSIQANWKRETALVQTALEAARKEKARRAEKHQQEVATRAEAARTELVNFRTAIHNKDLDKAEQAFIRFEAFNPEVHAHCFPGHDAGMEISRMRSRLSSLRHDTLGAGKVRLLK